MAQQTLEKGRDRIQAIGEELSRNVIAPAELEARKLKEEGQQLRSQLIEEGELERARLLKQAHEEIAQLKRNFDSNLEQAVIQAKESFRQQIEKELFQPQFVEVVKNSTADTVVVANFIDVIVQAIEKEGLKADLTAHIADKVNPEEVVKMVSKRVLSRLKGQKLLLDKELAGGASVYVEGENTLTVALTPEYLAELLWRHSQGALRQLLFGQEV